MSHQNELQVCHWNVINLMSHEQFSHESEGYHVSQRGGFWWGLTSGKSEVVSWASIPAPFSPQILKERVETILL